MNTLIIADLHLTEVFDQRKSEALTSLVNRFDRVIINGDLIDEHIVDWDKFWKSGWSKLIKLLRLKKLVYITGNHEINNYHNLFPKLKVTYSYKLKLGSKELIIIHGGDEIHELQKEYKKVNVLDNSLWAKNKNIYNLALKLKSFLITKVLKNFYEQLMKASNRRIKNPIFEMLRKKVVINNTLAKKYIASKLNDNQILIMSHTHIPEMNLKEKYINTGAVEYGFLNYIVLDNLGIRLESVRY